MLGKKLSTPELRIALIAMSPPIIICIILLTGYIHEINRSAELQLQVDIMHSEPLFPYSTIKAKMMHVVTNLTLLNKLISTPKDGEVIIAWNETKKILGELGANLISFSPKERFMIHDLNEQLKGTKSINHQNLEILLTYQDYLIASFASYVSLR